MKLLGNDLISFAGIYISFTAIYNLIEEMFIVLCKLNYSSQEKAPESGSTGLVGRKTIFSFRSLVEFVLAHLMFGIPRCLWYCVLLGKVKMWMVASVLSFNRVLNAKAIITTLCNY